MSHLQFVHFFPQYVDLHDMPSLMKLKQIRQQQTVLDFGESMNSVMFAISGRAKLFRPLYNGKEHFYCIYSPGNILGDLEFFTGTKSVSTVVATEAMELYILPFEEIHKRKNILGNTVFQLGKEVSLKLRNSSSPAALNTRYSLLARLAAYFVNLENIAPPLRAKSLGELAAWMGASYRHLTRTLRRLCELGALEKVPQGYLPANKELLEKYAEEALIEINL